MKIRTFLCLAFLLSSMLLCSCVQEIYTGFEGSKEEPVEISRELHSGYISHGYGCNYSYYTFVSDKANPTIVYEHVWPDDDIDCAVFINPDFYTGLIDENEAMNETTATVDSGDYTGVRLYVRIYNYDNNNDLTYDIYYY